MFGVNIFNYYDFAILLININNNVHLVLLNILKRHFPVMMDQDLYCTLVICIKFIQKNKILEAHVFVNKTVIKGN